MEQTTLANIVADWVNSQTGEFTSRDILEANDEIENVTQVSAVMNALYNDGVVARKKIDGRRFVFMDADIASDDFEKVERPKQAQKTRPIHQKPVQKNAPVFPDQSTIKPKLDGVEVASSAVKKHEVQQKPNSSMTLRESFTLTIKTQSGMEIVISSGSASA